MTTAEPECARARPHHDASLKDGSPANYKLWYKDYEDYHLQCLGWAGPDSAVGTWMKYTSPPEQKIKVFDAGCGTGLVAERLISQSGIPRDRMEIIGGDYSEEMIGLAEKKGVYDRLGVVNLKEKIPFEENEFDCILSSGVFLQGHCGPECVPNIVRVLKRGCIFVTTVRALFYDQTKSEWARQIAASGAELLEDNKVPYMTEVEAVALVIRKK